MIISNKPISFYKMLFTVFSQILLLFILAWGFLFLVSTESRRSFLIDNIQFAFFILSFLVSIALIQTWINSKIYIYYLEINGNNLILRWQEWNSFKETIVSIDCVKATLVPAGKNTPYLKIEIRQEAKKTVLKQTYFNTWNRQVMERVIESIKSAQIAS